MNLFFFSFFLTNSIMFTAWTEQLTVTVWISCMDVKHDCVLGWFLVTLNIIYFPPVSLFCWDAHCVSVKWQLFACCSKYGVVRLCSVIQRLSSTATRHDVSYDGDKLYSGTSCIQQLLQKCFKCEIKKKKVDLILWSVVPPASTP